MHAITTEELDMLFIRAMNSGMSLVCPLDYIAGKALPTSTVLCYRYSDDTWIAYDEASSVFAWHVNLYEKALPIRTYRKEAGLVPDREHQGGIFHPSGHEIMRFS